MGQNIDKRSYRKEHSKLYKQLIEHYREKLKAKEEKFANKENELNNDEKLKEELKNEKKELLNDLVKVFIRKRPIFEKEIEAKEFDVVTCVDKQAIVHDCRMHPSMKPYLAYVESFKFPYENSDVFSENVDTRQVYLDAVQPLVKYVVEESETGTFFCYGQTGSGKTYTITGLMQLLSQDLFYLIGQSKGKLRAKATCIELIGEHCYDLLGEHADVALREGGTGDVVICGNQEVEVKTGKQLFELYKYAGSLRETHATSVNSTSSRSHFICRVYIQDIESEKVCGQLTLCDLAGTERNADSMNHDAERRKETAQINSSLMALKEVIRAVALTKDTESKIHIPYRGSKLTRLLKDCFIDESKSSTQKKRPKTVVLATISPISTDTEHTVNTLKHTCLMMSDTTHSKVKTNKLVVKDVISEDPYNERDKLFKPIQKWEKEETLDWISQIQKGRFSKYVKKFPTVINGKQLSRLSESRLQQICGSNNAGSALRTEVKKYIEKTNRQKRKQAAEKRKQMKNF
jgi:kinesin family protein 2/24